jgi:hypothetical protein
MSSMMEMKSAHADKISFSDESEPGHVCQMRPAIARGGDVIRDGFRVWGNIRTTRVGLFVGGSACFPSSAELSIASPPPLRETTIGARSALTEEHLHAGGGHFGRHGGQARFVATDDGGDWRRRFTTAASRGIVGRRLLRVDDGLRICSVRSRGSGRAPSSTVGESRRFGGWRGGFAGRNPFGRSLVFAWLRLFELSPGFNCSLQAKKDGRCRTFSR